MIKDSPKKALAKRQACQSALRERVLSLEAMNRKQREEIRRLRAVEAALVRSEREQKLSLKESLQMQEELRNLSHGVLQIQEEERKRISLNLHDELAISIKTVEKHRAKLMKKLNIHDTASLTRYALNIGMIENDSSSDTV